MTQHSIIRSHRFRALVIAAPIALAACGSSATSVDAGAPTAGPLAPVPVEVNGASALQGEGAADPTGDAATSMIAPAVSITYELGEINELPTEAMGWVFEPGGGPSDAQVAALAEALGVDPANIVRDDDDPGPLDEAGAAGGQLWIGSDAQQSWSFTSFMGRGDVSCAPSVAPVDPDAEPEPEPETTTLEALDCTDELSAPENVPSEEAARTLARDLLTTMGEDPFGYHLEVYADEWSANVIAEPILDGVRVPLGLSFTFGANGALDFASGWLADPVSVGPYPLVDAATALDRRQTGVFGFSGITLGEPLAMTDEAVTSDCNPAADCGVDPVVGETSEEVTVVLSGGEPALFGTWEVSTGKVWLLPAFSFSDDRGNDVVIPAVADEFLIVDDVGGQAEPGPAEPAAPPATIGESTDPAAPEG